VVWGCDAKALGFGDGSFAAVMSNSIVHHIPKPQAVVTEMYRVLAQQGTFFIRDLLRPHDESELDRLVAAYAGNATETQRSLFHASLHAALTLDEVREITRPLGIPDAAVAQTSDRHWTIAAQK
jgi:ubiquinone/menaquinone biosynthesis C-methylase UbiE